MKTVSNIVPYGKPVHPFFFPLHFDAFKALAVCLFGVFILAATGCVTAPVTPKYSSSFSSIKRTSEFSNIRLGLLRSENVRKSEQFIEEHRALIQSLGIFTNTAALNDADMNYLMNGINTVLKNRFKSVVDLHHLEEAKTRDVDMCVVLDIRLQIGKSSGQATTVSLSGSFTDSDGGGIEKIATKGSAVIPFPASTYMVKPASSAALNDFSKNLDATDQLATAAKKIVARKSAVPAPSSSVHTAAAAKRPAAANKFQSGSAPMQHWAVVIGISEYQNTGTPGLANLIFADDDARAFTRSLHRLGWSKSHIKLLVNKDATQRNIMIALESWLTKSGPDDQIVLFWAGHGFSDPEDPEKVYFACYDTMINIPATGYRMDRVRAALEEKNAKNVIVLADTCHAGKLITRGGRGISIIPDIQRMKRQKTVPRGWIFMVGADTDRQAIEHSSWSNGAFTYSLIKGLTGEADGFQSAGEKDGVVTLGELKEFMNVSMPDETLKILGTAKRPVITTSSGDPDIWNLSLQPE